MFGHINIQLGIFIKTPYVGIIHYSLKICLVDTVIGRELVKFHVMLP